MCVTHVAHECTKPTQDTQHCVFTRSLLHVSPARLLQLSCAANAKKLWSAGRWGWNNKKPYLYAVLQSPVDSSGVLPCVKIAQYNSYFLNNRMFNRSLRLCDVHRWVWKHRSRSFVRSSVRRKAEQNMHATLPLVHSGPRAPSRPEPQPSLYKLSPSAGIRRCVERFSSNRGCE